MSGIHWAPTTALIVLGALAVPAGATQQQQATTGSEAVAPLVQPSVVYLEMVWTGFVYDRSVDDFVGEYDGAGGVTPMEFTARTRCTGFVVNPDGWIGTAGHCVDLADGKESLKNEAIAWALDYGYYTPDATFEGLKENQLYQTWTVPADGGDPVRNSVQRTVTAAWAAGVSGLSVTESTPARVDAMRSFEDGDVALLKVDTDGLNAIPLAGEDVEINDEVQSVGYPGVIDNFTDQNLIPTFNPGTVSSEKTLADGLLSVLQLSAPIRGGMSGGPTVNLAGEVVGVNSASFDGEPFNYAVPVDNLRQLLNGAGVENTLSETTRAYRRGVLALLAEDKLAAVRNLRTVVADQPANGLAQEYLAQARDLPDPPPPPEAAALSTAAWVGIGAAVLAVLGGMTVWLLRRGRGRRADAPDPGTGTPPPTSVESAAPTVGARTDLDPVGAAPLVEPSVVVASAPVPSTPDGPNGDPARTDTPVGAPVGFTAPPVPPASAAVSAATGVEATAPDPVVPAAPVATADGVPEQPSGHRFCGMCGAQSESPSMRFCGSCGAKL